MDSQFCFRHRAAINAIFSIDGPRLGAILRILFLALDESEWGAAMYYKLLSFSAVSEHTFRSCVVRYIGEADAVSDEMSDCSSTKAARHGRGTQPERGSFSFEVKKKGLR